MWDQSSILTLVIAGALILIAGAIVWHYLDGRRRRWPARGHEAEQLVHLQRLTLAVIAAEHYLAAQEAELDAFVATLPEALKEKARPRGLLGAALARLGDPTAPERAERAPAPSEPPEPASVRIPHSRARVLDLFATTRDPKNRPPSFGTNGA